MSDCGCLIEASFVSTECECKAAGYCRRHKVEKTEHLVGLCRNNPAYFALWESGNGPGQYPPKRLGLGDVVGWLASIVGIVPWPGCGCDKRKAWLNRVTVWGWWR